MPEVVQAAASHDDEPPQALLDFMITQWAPVAPPPPAWEEAPRFRARRERLSALFAADALVVPSGHEKTRANDTNHRFRPGTDFYYLTGMLEPDCVLVFEPEPGGHRCVAYVEPNLGKTNADFYTNRAKGELWVGPRLGVEQSAIRFGIETRALPELPEALQRIERERGTHGVRVLRGIDSGIDGAVAPAPETDTEFAAALSEMRLLKDEYEVAQLEKAIASTKRGFEDVLRGLPAAKSERTVEGLFNLRARVEGNDVGYATF